jgi:hypothetical protein
MWFNGIYGDFMGFMVIFHGIYSIYHQQSEICHMSFFSGLSWFVMICPFNQPNKSNQSLLKIDFY